MAWRGCGRIVSAILFCVADELMKEELYPRKVKPEDIKVTGIPVKPSFNQEYLIALLSLKNTGYLWIRRSYSLSRVLVCASPYVLFRELMDEIIEDLAAFDDMHFVFLTGSDEEYADQVRKHCTDCGVPNVSVYNYVEKIAELMNAADLAIAKSGGLAVTECLCSRLPLIIVGRSFGQEDANTTTVTRAGAAYQVLTSPELLEKLRETRKTRDARSHVEGGGRAAQARFGAQCCAGHAREGGQYRPYKEPLLLVLLGQKTPAHALR